MPRARTYARAPLLSAAASYQGRLMLRTPQRVVLSRRSVTSRALILDDVFQTPAGSTFSCRTTTEHGYSTGRTVTHYIEGLHGVTWRAHPANGAWTVTVVDEFEYILNGSTWVANSLFDHGYCHAEALFDAASEIARLVDMAKADGPGSLLVLPPGGVALLSDGFDLCNGLQVVGAERDATYLLAGPGLNANMIRGGYDTGQHTTLRDFSVYGNRVNQTTLGTHSIRYAAAAGQIIHGVTLRNVGSYGSPGYAVGLQGSGGWRGLDYDGLRVSWCYQDGLDTKDRSYLSRGNKARGCSFGEIGLGKIGLNYAPSALSSNPFTTTSGSSIVRVARPDNPTRAGIPVTYSGVPPVAGIDLNGTFEIVAFAADTYDIETNQTASASTTGGGPAVLEYASMYQINAAAMDARGPGWNITDMDFDGDYTGRQALRLRGDIVPGVPLLTGAPASFSNVKGLTGTNRQRSGLSRDVLPPAVLAGLQCEGSSVDGVKGVDFAVVAKGGPSSRRNNVSNVGGSGYDHLIHDQGDYNKFALSSGNGARVSTFRVGGEKVPTAGTFGADPFTTTNGSSVVVVHLPDHQLVPGDDLEIYRATTVNGLDVNGELSVSGAVDADNFEITVAGTATGSGAGGGSSAVYILIPPRLKTVTGTEFQLCASTGGAVGFHVYNTGIGVVFDLCGSFDDTLPFVDVGTGTEFNDSRGDLPRRVKPVYLPSAGTTNPTTVTYRDGGKVFAHKGTAAEQGVIVLPDASSDYEGLEVTVLNQSSLGVTISCANAPIRIGAVLAGIGAPIATTTVGATATLKMINGSWLSAGGYGTWAA